MKKMKIKLLNRSDEHMRELLSGAAVAFIVKVLAAGLSFGLNVVLARLLGAEGSGIFFLALTIVIIVAAIGRIGMENALVRFIAANISAELPGKVLGVYNKAMRYSFIIATLLSTLLYLIAPWLSQNIFNKPELTGPLTTMALAVVPLALLTLHANALQGLKKIAASTSVLSVYVPLITVIVAILLAPEYGLIVAIKGYLLATTVTLLIGRFFWLNATNSFKLQPSDFTRQELFSSSMPLFGAVIMNMVITWSPILFLGIWESNENVGIYSAASRTAMLTSFVLVAVNSIAAPKFSALYQQGDLKTLSAVARNSSKMMVLFASPALLLFIFIPEWVLSIFGTQFIQGANVLMILAIGQFVNVSTGSVGYLLMMSGNEHLMRNNLLFCAFSVILLSLWLIPQHGMLGAAIATASILSVQNLIAALLVWIKLDIDIITTIKFTRQ